MLIWCFFFNDTATTEIYTLSLHDALPISSVLRPCTGVYGCSRAYLEAKRETFWTPPAEVGSPTVGRWARTAERPGDRKSTRLNSSHANISYAVFCLKKNT